MLCEKMKNIQKNEENEENWRNLQKIIEICLNLHKNI